MRRLGVHTSIAGGLHLAITRAHALGCSTVQIFSHNPRSWRLTAIPEAEATLFSELRMGFDIDPVYVHCSYLINLSSSSGSTRRKSVEMLREEMNRADALGADFVILHLHGGKGEIAVTAEGIRGALSLRPAARPQEADARDSVREAPALKKAGLLIENTARSSMEDLHRAMDGSGGLISGVVIDTCHAFAAGYDLRTEKGLKRLVKETRECFGPGGVRLIHLNDSKGECGSGIDRHEHIGKGKIGSEALRTLIRHKTFRDVPLVLETPKKALGDDTMNLKTVRKIL